MPDVRIQHVIYTRVEKMYSPQGRNGYQIVYQSPSLGTETAQIEKYIQCFQTNKKHMNRYQFFWSENGQAVMTKSVSLLSPDSEVIDRNQRDAFLAHAIILSKDAFACVRNDPFAIFEAAEEQHLFTENVEQLVSYLKEAPAEQIAIPLRKQLSHLLDAWTPVDIQNLYWLGEGAATMNEQKKSVLMIAADPEEIFRLLSCLLILLTANERLACTFDTFVDGCTPAVGAFWAIGGTKHINNSNFVPLRLAERNFESFTKRSSVSAYSAWFSHALQTYEQLSQVNEDLYAAQIVAEAFSAKKALPDEPLKESVLDGFYRLQRQSIINSLYRALAALVDRPIADAMMPSITAYLSLQSGLSVAAQETFEKRTLAEILFSWLLKEQPVFRWWESSLKFAEQAEYMPLLLLASIKARPPLLRNYEKQQAQAVKALLDDGSLAQVLDKLLKSWPVTVPPATGTEVQQKSLELSDEEFQMFVNTLLQNNAGNLLQAHFVQRVALLQSQKVVLSLTKAVETSENVAPEFVEALRHHPLHK
jgi:hypothetical protein